MRVCVCICVCVHGYIHSHMHTRTHTSTHIHQVMPEDRQFAEARMGFPLIIGAHDHDPYLEQVAGATIVKTGADAAMAGEREGGREGVCACVPVRPCDCVPADILQPS